MGVRIDMEKRNIIQRFIHGLEFFENVSVGIFIVIMIIIVFLQVLFRYAILSPLVWSEEISRYAMVYLVFIGISIGIRDRAHLGVEVFINPLPQKVKKSINIFTQTGMEVLLIICFIYAIVATHNNYKAAQLTPAVRLPMFWIYLAMPIGLGVSCLRQFERIVLEIRELLTGDYNLKNKGGDTI
jgi:C4-dicarboxylate transporter DctQ subunit